METPPRGRISEVPLFPLDLVLFPEMEIPLHIFEPRYRLMVQRCLRENTPFGIVLLGNENPQTGKADFARVGCLARIVESEPLEGGRLNIQIVGEQRFRVLDTHENQPYWSGLIELLEDDPASMASWQPLVESATEALKDYLTLQLRRAGKKVSGFRLPTDPVLLSFTASCVLPIANTDKQSFLELTDTPSRLLAARDVLRRAALQLEKERTVPVERSESWEPITGERFRRYRCQN